MTKKWVLGAMALALVACNAKSLAKTSTTTSGSQPSYCATNNALPGCAGYSETSNTDTSNTDSSSADSSNAVPGVPAVRPAPAPISFSGVGKSVTKAFDIVGGLTIIRLTHRGSANFIVDLKDASTGDDVEGVANEIGDYTGSRVFGVDTGRYILNIDADGRWTARIEQPRPDSGTAVPHTFTGRGPTAVGPISLTSGLVTATMHHSGEANFIVSLLDSTGEEVDGLANEIGNFSGSQATQAPDDSVYWLDIEADGSWSVALGQ